MLPQSLSKSPLKAPVEKNDASSTVLILPAVADEEGEKLQNKVINKVAIEKRVTIDKSFKKKNGDTVIVTPVKPEIP